MYSGYQEEQDNTRKNVLGGVLGLGLLAAAPFGARAILKNRMAKKGKLSNIPNARGGQSGVRTGKKEINKFMGDIEAGSLGADYTPTSGPITGPNKGKTWGMNKDYYNASQEGVKLLTDPRTGEMYSPGGTRPPKDVPRASSAMLDTKGNKKGALSAVEQYSQMTGTNPYTQVPRKGLLKEQEAGRQRVANQGNIVLADLQNEAFVEREANKVITDLRQSQVKSAAQDAMNTAENQQDKNTLRKLRRDEDLDLNRTNIDYVQRFMTDRRMELADKGVTGIRAERILASDRNVKNAIELYAQTGDPNVFQLTRKDAPSMPMTVKPQDSSFVTDLSAVGQPEVSTGLFMKKDKRGAFTAPIEDREIDLVNRRGEINERQGELRGRIQQINEDVNMFSAAAENKPRKGLSGMNEDDFIVSKLRQQREGLKEEGIQNAEALFDINNELDAVRRDLVAEKEFGGRPEPKTFTGEPKRLFFEADEQGKPIAGTFEVRSDREMQDTANRGGGGRNEANFSAGGREDDLTREAVFVETSDGRYVPSVRRTRRSDDFGNLATDYEGDKTQTGSTVTRYGIEPGDNVKVDETVKPSQVAPGTTSRYQDLDDETLGMISLMGKGAEAEMATKEALRRPRDKSGESLKVSEGLRRARIEGRDPQSVLRRFGVIQ